MGFFSFEGFIHRKLLGTYHAYFSSTVYIQSPVRNFGKYVHYGVQGLRLLKIIKRKTVNIYFSSQIKSFENCFVLKVIHEGVELAGYVSQYHIELFLGS